MFKAGKKQRSSLTHSAIDPHTCSALASRDRECQDGCERLDKELGGARRSAVEGDRHEPRDPATLRGGEAVVEGHGDAAVRVVHLGGGLVEARAGGTLEALRADPLKEAAGAGELNTLHYRMPARKLA